MPEQTMLPLWPAEPREHDLPPLWDSYPVEWGEWRDTGTVFMCPPPRSREKCEHCGSTESQAINIGRIWSNPESAPPAIGRARLQRHQRHVVEVLSVFRCPDCEHDVVLDGDGTPWDLDPTDYTSNGSWEAPALGGRL